MRKSLLLIAAILFLIPFVSSQASVTQISPTPMIVETPPIFTLEKGVTHRFHAHVINQSGYRTNVTTQCSLHLYDNRGFDMDIGSQWMEFETYNGLDYAKNVTGGNFTRIGMYAYVITCNSSREVGFTTGQLEVTSDGFEYSINKPNIMYVMILFAAFFFGLTLLFDGKHYVIKTGLIAIGFLFLIMSANVMLEYSASTKETTMNSYALYTLIITAVIVIGGMLIYYFINIIKAVRDAKNPNRTDLD